MNKQVFNNLKKFTDAMEPALKEMGRKASSLRIKEENNE